jgi:alkylation response protein AidB-like acyl-CoA dehydrogenase
MSEGVMKGGSFLINNVQPEDIFVPEDINEDQRLLIKIVEEFLRGELEPRIVELEDKTEGLMAQLIKKSAEVGLLGVDIPARYGGTELDSVSSLIIAEKVSIGGPFAVAYLAHTAFGILSILYFGKNEQKERFLPDLASGRKIGAYALTEPDAGTDALNAKTIATLSEDGKYYILNGEKQFISNAGFADVFITYAKFIGEKFTAFILERPCHGLSLGKEEDKMGIRGASTRGLLMEDVKIPIQNLLFQIGEGHMVALNTLNIGRHRLSGTAIGAAKIAFGDTIRYAKSRVQFGQSLSEYGLIKEKIGEMAIRIFVAESMVYRTSKLLDEALHDTAISSNEVGFELARRIEEYAMECSINKVYASEVLDYVVDEAVQIHGGSGYIKDLPVERYYRDSRIYRIFAGTNEINRLLIVKMLLSRIRKGHLVLIDAMENAASKILKPSKTTISHRKGLEELAHLVETAKKIGLISLRAAVQAYGTDLEHHQEVMGMISNIIIEVFGSESCLLRTQKIGRIWGKEKSEISTAISQAYILDSFMRIEDWAKLIFAAIAEGNVLRTRLSDLERLTRYIPVNSVAYRRKIADFMFKAGKYFVL